MDDMPIRPSKEYLEQKENSQPKVVKTCTDYLKKSKPRYLPSATVAQLAKKPVSPHKPSPTKRQIYERIKQHNEILKAKYQSDEPIIAQSKPSLNKQPASLNSAKQLKPQEAKPKVSESSVQTEKPPIHSSAKGESYKQKYENMLKQLNQEREKMDRERKVLEQQKEYLEFKKQLKNVEGLRESKPMKPDPLEPKSKAVTARPKSSQPTRNKAALNEQKKLVGQTGTAGKPKQKQSPEKPDDKFRREMQQSKKLIESLTKKVEQLGSGTMRKTKNIEQLMEEADYEYTLIDLPKLEKFTLEQVNKVISLREFRHNANQFYRQFELNFSKYVVAKELKQGSKCVRQFANGCKETEVAKKYRLVEYPQSNYRLTIFANGDIKQEMPGPIVTYFSKGKQLNRINYLLNSQLYYFYELGQLELHTKTHLGETSKQIRYRDGSIAHLPKR